ncbi:ThiF family adenylyltransferase [Sanguibacter sp. A247]|uniref:ThiF family adenylyltransferase n=1 Tax=unclassified Sanguibacter TaxID=2645534 RepID=UPI003FD8860C
MTTETRPLPRPAATAHDAVPLLARDATTTESIAAPTDAVSSHVMSASVGILGLGRLGVQLARTLASVGVRRLVVDDAAVVGPDDLGVGGYRIGDVGMPRPRAAASVLADSPATRTTLSPGVLDGHDPGTLTAAVIVTHEQIDPACMWRLVAQGVPHLVVTWWPGRLEVGPGVIPGQTACLRCVDLHRADEHVPPARGRHVGHGAEDPVLAVAGAGLAAARTLELIDPRGSLSRLARSTSLVSPSLEHTSEYWPVHPACGCGSL